MRESAPAYAELAVMSNFSFLEGGSHAGELIMRAHALGLAGIGIADRNTFAGIVRAHDAWCDKDLGNARASGFRFLVGVRLCFRDGMPDILAYPSDLAAYSRLCQLLSLGKKRAPKGDCYLDVADLARHAEGVLMIVMPPEHPDAAFVGRLETMVALAPGRVWLAATMPRRGADRRRLVGLAALAEAAGLPLIATNDVLYHAPDRRPLQDVLTCIREKTTVEKAGRLLEGNAERHLKHGAEMMRLFRDRPEAVAETMRFMARIHFTLDEIKYHYPAESVPPGMTPQQHLEVLTWKGARERFPDGIPLEVETTLKKELAFIEKLEYPAYFLTVHDIVAYAREIGIL